MKLLTALLYLPLIAADVYLIEGPRDVALVALDRASALVTMHSALRQDHTLATLDDRQRVVVESAGLRVSRASRELTKAGIGLPGETAPETPTQAEVLSSIPNNLPIARWPGELGSTSPFSEV